MARIFGEPLTPKKPKTVKPTPVPKKRKPLLLYVHVPFCVSKCHYCAFHSQAFNQVTYSWYLKTLLSEIELWSERLVRPTIHTVYFGGGTPSLVAARDMERVVKALRRAFDFEKGLEMSMEANPDSCKNLAYLRALRSLGFNRLSIGVQSFSDHDLKLLGRPHTARDGREAYDTARAAGFANVSMDLIWGLPDQRLKVWLDELGLAVKLGPEHLSCYNLTLEQDTPFERYCRAPGVNLPPEQEQARMFVYGAEFLESKAYLHYEISNFARMGFSCRHNMGYWEGMDYLGLGPSAVSTIGGRRFTNPKFMDAYDAAVRGAFAGSDYEQLDTAVLAQEKVMLSLRTSRGLNLKAYRQLTGDDLMKKEESLIHALHRNHLIRISQGHLRLTKNGMLVSNAIIARLAGMGELEPGEAEDTAGEDDVLDLEKQ